MEVIFLNITGITYESMSSIPMVIICLPDAFILRALRISTTSMNMPIKNATAIPIINPSQSGSPAYNAICVVINVPKVAISPCAKLVVPVVLKIRTIPIVARE